MRVGSHRALGPELGQGRVFLHELVVQLCNFVVCAAELVVGAQDLALVLALCNAGLCLRLRQLRSEHLGLCAVLRRCPRCGLELLCRSVQLGLKVEELGAGEGLCPLAVVVGRAVGRAAAIALRAVIQRRKPGPVENARDGRAAEVVADLAPGAPVAVHLVAVDAKHAAAAFTPGVRLRRAALRIVKVSVRVRVHGFQDGQLVRPDSALFFQLLVRGVALGNQPAVLSLMEGDLLFQSRRLGGLVGKPRPGRLEARDPVHEHPQLVGFALELCL